MQSLRSIGIRRLCLSLTASVTRGQKNLLPSTLFCHTRGFASASPRLNTDGSQFSRIIEDVTGEESKEVEVGHSAPSGTKNPTNTLFLVNIPYSTTEHDLQEALSGYGPITRVSLGRTNEGMPKGYAHVEFSTRRDAMKVVKDCEESPLVIGGRTARIDYGYSGTPKGGHGLPRRAIKDRYGPGPTIFVGGLPETAMEEDILEALKPYGKVVAVRLGRGKDGTFKRFAHADFEDANEAEKVLEHYQHHPIHVLDWEVRLDRASDSTSSANPPSPRLHFAGWEGSAPSLRAHFRALGSKIVELFPYNSDPNARTLSGFIEFRDLDTAKEALARFNGPGLSLMYARPRDRERARPGSKRKGTEWRDPSFGFKKAA